MTTRSNTTPAPPMPAEWTLQTVFKHPERDPTGEYWAMLPPGNTTARFTDAFTARLKEETHWELLEPLPAIPADLRQRVGTSSGPCPVCEDLGSVSLLHLGKVTKIPMYRRVRCSCPALKIFWGYWSKVPERFRSADIRTIQPRGLAGISVARQAKIITALRERPSDSYLLYGPAGTGKTHCAAALYRLACAFASNTQYNRIDMCISGPVWRVETSTLLAEHAEWATRDKHDETCSVPIPTVTKGMIVNAASKGYRPCLFLEEIDKVGFTEARINKLCELVNAVYEANGQVVATSNKDIAALEKKWGTDEAGTLLRRITEKPNGRMVYFAD